MTTHLSETPKWLQGCFSVGGIFGLFVGGAMLFGGIRRGDGVAIIIGLLFILITVLWPIFFAFVMRARARYLCKIAEEDLFQGTLGKGVRRTAGAGIHLCAAQGAMELHREISQHYLGRGSAGGCASHPRHTDTGPLPHASRWIACFVSSQGYKDAK